MVNHEPVELPVIDFTAFREGSIGPLHTRCHRQALANLHSSPLHRLRVHEATWVNHLLRALESRYGGEPLHQEGVKQMHGAAIVCRAQEEPSCCDAASCCQCVFRDHTTVDSIDETCRNSLLEQ
jgi:hypothetical protein